LCGQRPACGNGRRIARPPVVYGGATFTAGINGEQAGGLIAPARAAELSRKVHFVITPAIVIARVNLRKLAGTRLTLYRRCNFHASLSLTSLTGDDPELKGRASPRVPKLTLTR